MNLKNLFMPYAATTPEQDIRIHLQDDLLLIALGAVLAFAAIGLLWAVLSVFKKVFGGGSRSESEEPVVNTISAHASAPVSAPASDAQLIAVLTAAVAAYMAEENGTAPDSSTFRVVSFKRVSNGRAWNSK